MENIVALGKYTLAKDQGSIESKKAHFTVNLEYGLQAEVSVDYESNEINTIIKNIQVKDGFIATLKNQNQLNNERTLKKYRNDIEFIKSSLSASTRQVISLIKYYLRHTSISEYLFAVKGNYWGETIECQYQFPMQLSFSVSNQSYEPLNENSIKNIQFAIDRKIEPLLAMRHLQRAKIERHPHYKWIDATIAAELAIKEVLIKAKPELEILLMEIPSPPLYKLYKGILKEYLGVESPYHKTIREGVDMRNALVHKPNNSELDSQKANDYVATIEAAIFHLLSLIYPDIPLIKEGFTRSHFYQTNGIRK